MQKLWTDRVQGGYGKELHGDDYADIWAINRLHYKAASPEPCDHVSSSLHAPEYTDEDSAVIVRQYRC